MCGVDSITSRATRTGFLARVVTATAPPPAGIEQGIVLKADARAHGHDGRSTGAQDLIARTVRRGPAITQGLFLFL